MGRIAEIEAKIEQGRIAMEALKESFDFLEMIFNGSYDPKGKVARYHKMHDEIMDHHDEKRRLLKSAEDHRLEAGDHAIQSHGPSFGGITALGCFVTSLVLISLAKVIYDILAAF